MAGQRAACHDESQDKFNSRKKHDNHGGIIGQRNKLDI